MASFWFWLGVSLGSLIGGVVIAFILFFFYASFTDFIKYKRGFPRGKERVSQYIKDNEEKFKDAEAHKPKSTEKEVIVNERTRRAKFREFEKLRDAYLKRPTDTSTQRDRSPKGSVQLPTRQLLSNDSDKSNNDTSGQLREDKRTVRLDD